MATRATQLLRQLPDGSIFADPVQPSFNVRFKTTTSRKSLNGVQTNNLITEIIITDDNQVTIGGINAVDALSVRLRVSGAVESLDRLKEILSGACAQVNSWTNENVLTGFTPSTVPLNTF